MFALSGAALWGLIGLFVHGLYTYGWTPWEVVAARVVFSGVVMILFLFFYDRSLLRIQLRDTFYFFGTGILSIVFFNWCYFFVMQKASLSLAVILLYTGPVFVAILSRFVFGEPFTSKKIAALLLTVVGCGLAIGFFPVLEYQLSWTVMAVGLCSGFCYALYSIFGKIVSQRYSSFTITTYSFLFAALFMIPFGGWIDRLDTFLFPAVSIYAAGLAIVPTCLAYVLYTFGLARMESSKASIFATVEPVVAVLIGIVVFDDVITFWKALGMILILTAIVLATDQRQAASPSKKNAEY